MLARVAQGNYSPWSFSYRPHCTYWSVLSQPLANIPQNSPHAWLILSYYFFCRHLFLVRGFKDNSTASCLSLFCNFTCDNFGLSMFYGVKFCLWNSFSVQCRTQFFWWVKIMLQTKRTKIMVIEILILYMTNCQLYHQHDITLCYHHLNPLHPNISRHILYTVLYTFLNSVSATPSNYRVRTKFHHKPFHSQDFRINSPYILHIFLKM